MSYSVRKTKVYSINTETEAGSKTYQSLFKVDSWLFKIMEEIFWQEFEAANPANELEEKYFGEEAIYDKKGAIQQMIEQVFEVIKEYKLPFIFLDDNRLDFSCCVND